MEEEKINGEIVRQLNLSDWQNYKNIRLEALQNDPQAFGGSYAEESQRIDKEWQDRLQKVIGENSKSLLVAAENGKGDLVGTIGAFEKLDGVWRINAVYVKPAYRGKGLSAKLLKQITDLISSRNNSKELELTVNIKQEAAVRLYQSSGFKIVGIEKGHVMGDGQSYDSYMMKKELM